MKKLIAILMALVLAISLAAPASAVTMGWDLSKAQGSINNAVTEIVTAPTFSWADWLARILEGWK